MKHNIFRHNDILRRHASGHYRHPSRWYGVDDMEPLQSISEYRIACRYTNKQDMDFECYVPDPDFDDCCVKVRINEVELIQALRSQTDIHRKTREEGIFIGELFEKPMADKLLFASEHYDIFALMHIFDIPDGIPIEDITISRESLDKFKIEYVTNDGASHESEVLSYSNYDAATSFLRKLANTMEDIPHLYIREFRIIPEDESSDDGVLIWNYKMATIKCKDCRSEYFVTDQTKYYAECPYCGKKQKIKWEEVEEADAFHNYGIDI